MIDPWTFDIAEGFSASNDEYQIKYENIHEMSQGSPLTGACHLWKKGKKVQVSKTCGGPPLWSNDCKYFIVPIWKNLLSQGTIQKIALVNVEEETIKYSKSNYTVLHLIKLENDRLEFINNLISRPKNIVIQIEDIEFEKEEQLKCIR